MLQRGLLPPLRGGNGLEEAGALAVARCAALRRLHIGGDTIGARGAKAIAQGPAPPESEGFRQPAALVLSNGPFKALNSPCLYQAV